MPGCKPGDIAIIIGPLNYEPLKGNIGLVVQVIQETTQTLKQHFPNKETKKCFEIRLKGEGSLAAMDLATGKIMSTNFIVMYEDNWLQPIRKSSSPLTYSKEFNINNHMKIPRN